MLFCTISFQMYAIRSPAHVELWTEESRKFPISRSTGVVMEKTTVATALMNLIAKIVSLEKHPGHFYFISIS